MARIRSYDRGTRSVREHQTQTDCSYQLLDDNSGGTLLALSTFGSDDRKEKNTVSQSMQFDEPMARLLLASIWEAFPSLRTAAHGDPDTGLSKTTN